MTKSSRKGKIVFDNGDVYKGEFQGFQPCGQGKIMYHDGSVAQVIWKNGEIIYEGELNDKGRRHGKGVNKWPSGNSYEGEWRDNKRHGKGIFKYANGDSYEGEWLNGEMACGRYKWPNGDMYEGEYVNGDRNGKGVMTYANHDIYDGEWKEGRKDGKGVMKYANGDFYKGSFSQGEMHGHGVFEYAEGDLLKSTAEWKDGNKCGEFEDVLRAKPMKVYYNQNGEVESEVRVKREAAYDEDTDTEYFSPSKRRNVSF